VVRWSVDPPDAGTISADGLYTAPTHPGKVTIRGIGFTDPARPGRATVSVGEFVPIRIRAGTDADYGYESGSVYSSTAAVSGTSTPEVYQSERFDTRRFRYRFHVPNGRYRVILKFAEIWFKEAGKRRFDVLVNGQTVLKDFDILARAGGANKAVDQRFLTSVANGEIHIEFVPIVSSPKISGIEILPE
jgi:hypothetical protein